MAIRKFLTSVAQVFGYDNNEKIVFTGKTLIDSSMEVSLGSAPVRGGRGNQLQYIYYHTGEMKFTLTDTQWNLGMLAATVGSDIVTSDNAYQEVSVALTSTTGGNMPAGVVPLSFTGTGVVYGWATTATGDTYRVEFTTGTPWSFLTLPADGSPVLGAISDNICVRFYVLTPAAQVVTVKANMIPKVVRLVMETQLNSADVTSNKIGIVQIIAPTVTLSGAFTLSMKADGVSNTPLTATALAYNGAAGTDACSNEPYYARLIEIIDAANWYDNVIGLSVVGGDFTMANSTTHTLNVWAIPAGGAAFKVANSALDFALVGTPSATGTTVGAHTGVVTSLAVDGTADIKINITAVPLIDTTVTATVA
jgi:hypothetical protein